MNAPEFCGIDRPKPAPKPRDAATIAAEIRRAANHLEFIAIDIGAGAGAGVTAAAITEADQVVVGLGRLLVELRIREDGAQ